MRTVAAIIGRCSFYCARFRFCPSEGFVFWRDDLKT